jgi:peptidoglycan hydrolase-like protein with peptidoglycan-binding domain
MPILQRGSSGPDVQTLQQQLTALGFDPNGVDGIFGPGTEAAVRAFQQAQGLTVDGKVGPQTNAALQSAGSGDGAASGGSTDSTNNTAGAQKEKVLWVVGYNSLAQFLQRAQAAKVTAVAIRTDNHVDQALQPFHDAGMKVYGWRWPSAQQGGAMAEANRAAALLNQGMDGYFADPEGEPGQPFDWNRPGLADLANQFCTTIKAAAGAKPLGVTSHFLAKQVFPNLPWAAFFAHADILLPQAYWRVAGGSVHHGDPAQNYRDSIQAWVQTGGARNKIQPMAGELIHSQPNEIGAYAQEANAQGVSTLHFYTDEPDINPGVWSAIAQA